MSRAKNADRDEQIIALDRQHDDDERWRDNGGEQPSSAATAAADEGVSLDDFRALMTMHAYIFTPARDVACGERQRPARHRSAVGRERQTPDR
jgi:hypothetical protein